ncbi:unnamed protein product [Periconia digitata]|uniref:Nucleotide-diphospho-sugar transferase n=1 Tax=Periconia digitata TaxID=1303443 RepID=A0A9W4UN43_9PLEO|nr:unnamed protein product [Periconia digitata]
MCVPARPSVSWTRTTRISRWSRRFPSPGWPVCSWILEVGVSGVFLLGTALILVLFLVVYLTALSPSLLKLIVPHVPLHINNIRVNWTHSAYIQSITNQNYLCNSVMIMEALHRAGAKADRIMMYPDHWHIPKASDSRAVEETQDLQRTEWMLRARDEYKAKLVPIRVLSGTQGDPTWRDSFTKLIAFNQTQYKRLLSLDSDATVMTHMDELFLTPSSPVAMPRAYWLDQSFLSSQVVLLTPSQFDFQRVQALTHQSDSGFDMDILNTLYKDSCIVLPHRPYNALSAEFRFVNHTRYLGSEDEVWNVTNALAEAKYTHSSDCPKRKPWLRASEGEVRSTQPDCGGNEACEERKIWLELYLDFSRRRERICGQKYD